jgi:hypothetical protein
MDSGADNAAKSGLRGRVRVIAYVLLAALVAALLLLGLVRAVVYSELAISRWDAVDLDR